jgi:hypothetical protein
MIEKEDPTSDSDRAAKLKEKFKIPGDSGLQIDSRELRVTTDDFRNARAQHH